MDGLLIIEPLHDKTNKVACAPSKDSDQPGHPPSLIRVFAVRMKKVLIVSYPLGAKQRLWSDWADAQADLSLRWAHMWISWFCHVAALIYTEAIFKNCLFAVPLPSIFWLGWQVGFFPFLLLDNETIVFSNKKWGKKAFIPRSAKKRFWAGGFKVGR